MCILAVSVRRLWSTREGLSVRSYISRPMGIAGGTISWYMGCCVSVGLPGSRGDRGRGMGDYGILVGFIYPIRFIPSRFLRFSGFVVCPM